MFDYLKLKREVSETTDSIDPDDVMNVKKKLKNLNYYKEPEWGIDKIADNSMFEGIKNFQKDKKLKVDAVMKPEGETESKINETLNKAAYGSAGAMQGLSFGYADEIEGVMGGFGYGIGALSTGREKVADAAKRGYEKYRDERREQLKDGYKNMPLVTGVSEVVGAIAGPMKFAKIAKTAPIRVRAAQSMKDAVTGGAIYGIGAGEGGVKNHTINAAIGSVGGAIGNKASRYIDKNITGGFNSRVLRSGVDRSIEEGASNLVEKVLKYKKKDEK